MARYIPYILHWDDAPIDISNIFSNEIPAGRHGFLKTSGEKFLFDDGTEVCFWGVNFNSNANFPTHDHSEKVARRLAKFGVNMVRLHQMDSDWALPNIFTFERGPHEKSNLELHPKSMERLDYLIYCLKQNGIYVYLDLLTYRRFKSADGVVNAHLLNDSAKPYSTFDRTMIELQKKYNHDLFNHYNPYTNLLYKNDPVIVLTGINNETDLFTDTVAVEPYRTMLVERYIKWAQEKGITVKSDFVSFNGDSKDHLGRMVLKDEIMLEFLTGIMKQYYDEMTADLRAIGVRIPVNGNPRAKNTALHCAQADADFYDVHNYWWPEEGNRHRFFSKEMLKSRHIMAPLLAFGRVAGKPFFNSEWDSPWPNEFRADATLIMAALGRLQGCGGFTLHAYRYSTQEEECVTHKLSRELALGGSHYRGLFDTYNDPAKFGLFYHAALIMRRGDVRPSNKRIGIKLDLLSTIPDECAALELLPEKHGTRMLLPGMANDVDAVIDANKREIPEDTAEITSDTGELYRNVQKGFGYIDTPFTKAVYGKIGLRELNLNGVYIKSVTDFGTIAISSLTDDPISCSENLLITSVGRSKNTGYLEETIDVKCNAKKVVDTGNPPVLIEVKGVSM